MILDYIIAFESNACTLHKCLYILHNLHLREAEFDIRKEIIYYVVY